MSDLQPTKEDDSDSDEEFESADEDHSERKEKSLANVKKCQSLSPRMKLIDAESVEESLKTRSRVEKSGKNSTLTIPPKKDRQQPGNSKLPEVPTTTKEDSEITLKSAEESECIAKLSACSTVANTESEEYWEATEKSKSEVSKNVFETAAFEGSEQLAVVNDEPWERRLKDSPSEDGKTLIFTALDKMNTSSSSAKPRGWGSWSSWGSSLVSTATASVQSFSNQVGEGLNTVLGTVETAIGIPLPEEAAAKAIEIEKKLEGDSESGEKKEEAGFLPEELTFVGKGIFSTMSTVSNLVEKTGTKVIHGSLGTLEMIGKKTMDVLQEGDPGLKKKRSLFVQNKYCLSDLLREAKEQAETNASSSSNQCENTKIHYSTYFDEYQGIVHLEALEMLSKVNEAKLISTLQKLSSDVKEQIEPELEAIQHTCDLEELDDECSDDKYEGANTMSNFQKISKSITSAKLDEVYDKAMQLLSTWPSDKEVTAAVIIDFHNETIKLLAEITARAVELLHKAATCLVLPHDIQDQEVARNLADFSLSVHGKLNSYSMRFSESLRANTEDLIDDDDPKMIFDVGESTNSLITNVFLETSNSCSYIQDALHLVVPIMQLNTVSVAISSDH